MSIDLKEVKKNDIIWISNQYSDTPFVAIDDCENVDDELFTFKAWCVKKDGSLGVTRLSQDLSVPDYLNPRFYDSPAYSRPGQSLNGKEKLNKLLIMISDATEHNFKLLN